MPTGVPNVEEAIDKAFESKSCGVALKDATISNEIFMIPLFFEHHGFVVEGRF